MNEAYFKVLNIIKNAPFITIESGSVKNLINNFNNMYNNKELSKSLNTIYKEKLKQYQL